MVQVKTSKNNFVNVEFIGLAEVQRRIQAKGRKIISNVDIGMLRGANYIQQEVQESIAGNRAEKASVESGKLANSIEVDKPAENIFIIAPDKVGYPNGQNTQQVMRYLEFGTSKIAPRRHMRNTFSRTKDRVEDIVKDTIKF